MADVKISELTAALTVGDSDVIPMTASGSTVKASVSLLKQYYIGTTDISAIGDGSVTGAISTLNSGKAPKSDLASISITGSTNNTGNTILSGTYFYKDGALVKAIADIANGATLTNGTNYETITAGVLNDMVTKDGTVTAESGYSFVAGYDNKAHRCVNTIFVNLKVTQFTPSSTAWVNIATLPTGFRPTNQVFFPVMDDKQGIAVSGRIDNNGKVYVWGTANTAILPFVNTTFIVS